MHLLIIIFVHLELKDKLALFMQYLCPVVFEGPSSNLWPRCESHLAHLTYIRTIP